MEDAPDPARPDVSVVVVNFRSAELTVRALRDCAAAAGDLALEEIVVEGGSGPGEADRLRAGRPGARVVELAENRGFAAGNNAGIAVARGRHLLLLNPDAFAHGHAVARLVEELDRRPSWGLAAPLLQFEDGRPQDNVHSRFPTLLTLFVDCCAPVAFLVRGTRLDPHNVTRSQLTAPREVAHAIGAVLLVRREAAAAAGPLDERFFLYLEETEWQRRMAAAGWAIGVVPDAVFTHLAGGSSESGSPLASPHYLDSVERFYPRPRLALATMGLGALVSLAALRPAVALRLGSARTAGLARDMAVLLRQVVRRLRAGR
ncbi:MAG TPA: glycosyltransferase family 2 protein [Baekduia sp.]|nr:glycosyltransferase family 2 protein [Baekduia sp.]